MKELKFLKRNSDVTLRAIVICYSVIQERICVARMMPRKSIILQKSNTSDLEELKKLDDQLKSLNTEMELHKRKPNLFHKLKRTPRLNAQKTNDFEAITVDLSLIHI